MFSPIVHVVIASLNKGIDIRLAKQYPTEESCFASIYKNHDLIRHTTISLFNLKEDEEIDQLGECRPTKK